MDEVCRSIRINFLDEIRALKVFNVTAEGYPRWFCIISLRNNCHADEI